MRLNINKKIFFVILFFLFFIVINNKCFADDELSSSYRSLSAQEKVEDLQSRPQYVSTDSDLPYIFLFFTYTRCWIAFSENPIICIRVGYQSGSSSFKGIGDVAVYDIGAYSVNRSFNSFEDYSNVNGLNSRIGTNEMIQTMSVNYDICDINGNVIWSKESYSGNLQEVSVEPQIVYETPTLYIDDMNFRKRFSFQFNIPMIREDTKYYVFLEDYNRIDYSTVSATFRIYTITTPEGYDYTDYENYMYYDNLDKKLYFPAGCEIKEYSCSGANGDIYNLTLENEFTAERELQHYGSYLDIGSFDSFFQNSGLGVASLANIGGYKTYLYPVNFNVNSFDSTNFFLTLYNALKGRFSSTDEMLKAHNNKSYSDYFYNTFLHSIYYNNNSLDFGISDLCFSSSNISSYENMKSLNIKNSTIYNFFRSTNIFDYTKNWLGGDYYAFQYTDSEDVSSMLPQGTSVEYLTSPFYKDNEKSSSGGYITYDINEILQGDKIIDYSKEDNSIHNNFNGDYIENYQEGDNIVINNYYVNTIDKTSDENLLHNIYLAILEIKLKLSDIGNSISNTTNNFIYNTENNIKYYFVPNSYAMDHIKEELEDVAEEHLGIIYQPFQRYSIYIWCYFWSSN